MTDIPGLLCPRSGVALAPAPGATLEDRDSRRGHNGKGLSLLAGCTGKMNPYPSSLPTSLPESEVALLHSHHGLSVPQSWEGGSQ